MTREQQLELIQSAIDSGMTEHIQVNFPDTEENFKSGNGEGMWVLVDKETKRAYDADATGGSYKGVLDNNSWYYPGLTVGTVVPFEMRGEHRPVADYQWLVQNFVSNRTGMRGIYTALYEMNLEGAEDEYIEQYEGTYSPELIPLDITEEGVFGYLQNLVSEILDDTGDESEAVGWLRDAGADDELIGRLGLN
jgi:hypothetical protein